MGFSGTRYPHHDTMVALGIARDVAFLFEECNLSTLMMEPHAGYKKETCQFLATMEVTYYATEEEALENGHCAEEVGFITFEVNSVGYLLLISQVDELFDFPARPGTERDFNKDELEELWKFIASGGDYSSARSKSSHIRSPVLRYFHKSLACTFYARKVTGNVNEGELQMLDIALMDLMNNMNLLRVFHGDVARGSRAIMLLDQLMGYRDWAVKLHRRGRKSELAVGGIVTPILRAAGVELLTTPYEPLRLDLVCLKKQHILVAQSMSQGHLYRFTHPGLGEASVILPNTSITKLRNGKNIDFLPHAEDVYDPSAENIREERDEFEEDIGRVTSDYDVEDESATGHFTFEDDPPAKTIKEANRRISLLQKWNKWQDRTVRGTVKALKTSVKELKDSVKELAAQLKDLKVRKPKSPSESVLKRCGSYSFGASTRRQVDPPRRSAVEPRRSGATSLRHSKSKRRRALNQQTDHHASSSHQPEYTQQSMDDYQASFFDAP